MARFLVRLCTSSPGAIDQSTSSLFLCFIHSVPCSSVLFLWIVVWIFAGTRPGLTLELPDRKARGFLVPFAFKRLYPEHAHKVFGEMPVRT
jgi:hypothetical protein